MKNITLTLNDPCFFIGAIVSKRRTVCKCVRLEDYTKTNGEKTQLLVWECFHLKTEKMMIRKTSSKAFKTSDLPSTAKAFEKCV